MAVLELSVPAIRLTLVLAISSFSSERRLNSKGQRDESHV